MIVDALGTQTISIAIANYDNNQHGSNEDIKLLMNWSPEAKKSLRGGMSCSRPV